MNALLSSGAIVLFGAAAFLTATQGKGNPWRWIGGLACALAFMLLLRSPAMFAGSAAPLAAAAMLLNLIGLIVLEPDPASERSIATALTMAGACIWVAVDSNPRTAVWACVAAFFVGGSEIVAARGTARVFQVKQAAAYLLLITTFVLVGHFEASTVALLGNARDIVVAIAFGSGLAMAFGIPPFQFGSLDLYDRGVSTPALFHGGTPLPWFLSALATQELSDSIRVVLSWGLAAAFTVATVSMLNAARPAFLASLRSALTAFALLGLVLATKSPLYALIPFVAYLTTMSGLLAIVRLSEIRLGRGLSSAGGLAHRLPTLGGFALFFSLSLAGLPISATFFGAKIVGTHAVAFSVPFAGVVLFALALLGIGAYRHYTQTFLGPANKAVPIELDIGRRERLGLATLVLISVSVAAWGLVDHIS